MEVLWIVLGSLLALFVISIGIACCKISGDAEEDAERCFEAWLKSKQEEAPKSEPKGGRHDSDRLLYK